MFNSVNRLERFVKQPILDQEQRSPGAGRPSFEFISVSGTNIRGSAETRRRVRSRAQADYRRRNPPPPRNALTVDLDVGSWLQALSGETAPRPPLERLEPSEMQPVLQTSEIMQMDTHEFDHIGAENSANIFALVPADQRPRARQLWNHCLYSLTGQLFILTCSQY